MKLSLSSRHVRFTLLATLAVSAACKDSTAVRQPSAVTQGDAAVAEDTVGTVVTPSPTFVIRDDSGDPIGGVSVSIAVTAGGGTLTDAPVKSSSGPTPVGTWKLGNIAGVNSLTISVGSLPPLVISVTGKAGPPASIAFISGANQSALAGTPLLSSPVAQVRDQYGNGVAGAPVTFTVIDGEGSIASGAAFLTDASGNVSAPPWTLGKLAIPQSLRATTTGNVGAIVTANVTTSYNVDVRFFGPPMPDAAGNMFKTAAARIMASVTGDVPDIPPRFPGFDLASDSVGCGVPDLPTNFTDAIDDLVVFASVGPIDGVNNTLAFAFACGVRQGPAGLSFIGIMKFDSDDIANMIARGNLTDVITHEMLHIVGIGTLWSRFGLVAGAGTSQTRYTGLMGINGCISVGGATVCPTGVPLEPRSDRAGPGTADVHWSEDVFFNELMTGFVNTRNTVPTGIINPLSVMTIQSLADFGYAVNSNAADPYTIPFTSASGVLGQLNVGTPANPWEQVRTPRIEVTPNGRIRPIAQQ